MTETVIDPDHRKKLAVSQLPGYRYDNIPQQQIFPASCIYNTTQLPSVQHRMLDTIYKLPTPHSYFLFYTEHPMFGSPERCLSSHAFDTDSITAKTIYSNSLLTPILVTFHTNYPIFINT